MAPVPPGEEAAEFVIEPRGWTYGSSFFAWNFGANAYRSFDAHYIADVARVDPAESNAGGRPQRRGARLASPGRSGFVPPLPVPPVPMSKTSPVQPQNIGRVLAAAVLVAMFIAWLLVPDLRATAVQRIFGTPTSTAAPTATPMPISTSTPDPAVLRAATATASELSWQATRAAPCYFDNGLCMEIATGVVVLAIPPDARFLAYSTPQIDAVRARAVMRHHVRMIIARTADDAWLQLRMTNGDELWVQAAAVGASGSLQALPVANIVDPR
ncbi:MAG: hypothetical protein NTZ50_10635 [Chloroflexi bacterium]|nr:hypothetical protein [Chloroflexota bacterium]